MLHPEILHAQKNVVKFLGKFFITMENLSVKPEGNAFLVVPQDYASLTVGLSWEADQHYYRSLFLECDPLCL